MQISNAPLRRALGTLSVAALCAVTACNAAGGNRALPNAYAPNAAASQGLARRSHVDTTSLLKLLRKQSTVGSTVDPLNGDRNPYGLAVIPASSGKLKKGSLAICNFNDKANKQGTGTTIDTLATAPGSKPVRFAQSSNALGCAALAFDGYANLWASAAAAKGVLGLRSNGKQLKNLRGPAYAQPFGAAYVTDASGSVSGYPTWGLYASDATKGTIVMAERYSDGLTYPATPVVSGFAVNHAKFGSALGPSGLVGETMPGSSSNTLFVVDGASNTVVAIGSYCGKKAYPFTNVVQANSVVVQPGGKTFKYLNKNLDATACVVYAGKPLDAPISAALLPNGNLVVGNTGNNELVEIETSLPGKILATRRVVGGAAGALFGIAATGTSDANSRIYFNDDNTNAVHVLQK